MAVSEELLRWARSVEALSAMLELVLRLEARGERVPEGAVTELREAWREVAQRVPPVVSQGWVGPPL